MITIEICANSIASALSAQGGGAQRIELCESLETGGLTPSYGTLMGVKECLRIPVHVLIRPRNGDYVYDNQLIDVMMRDIELVKKIGFQGVVIGILDRHAQLDTDRFRLLLEVAAGLDITFHRAFDVAADPMKLAGQLADLGVDRILTSGQAATALKGVKLLAELVRNCGHNIAIMAGGGIQSKNILNIIGLTGVKECHLSAKRTITGQLADHLTAEFNPGEFDRLETDETEVRKIVSLTGNRS
ncbi:MAG: copper homeostasis protein CutC [Bacteroidales bacterium]|nr:copper homeostasis protein CutC [Bacteroidales bacterium]